MRHLDLFSGIGGFSLAAQNVWKNDYENIGFCDFDPFCQKVLKKNFPNSIIYGDIKKLNAKGIKADLITGGFPCQPFSHAGKRRGTEDDRHLWPEMLRIIREVSPSWIIAENVGGLVTWNGGLVLNMVISDLEAEGYEVQPFIIPACAVGAPHRRDRVWIIGYAEHDGWDGSKDRKSTQKGARSDQNGKEELVQPSRPNSLRQELTNGWEEDWPTVAARICRMDDGLPNRMDRIKALGNSIVPQVVEKIMQGIKRT
jgi:DNA (cytosine-5)-methyltransferase 1